MTPHALYYFTLMLKIGPGSRSLVDSPRFKNVLFRESLALIRIDPLIDLNLRFKTFQLIYGAL